MQFEIIDDQKYHRLGLKRPNVKIVGLKTSIQANEQPNEIQSKIGAMVNAYFSKNFSKQIPHRANPNVTYVVYANYESNFKGSYDYLIGEQCASDDPKLDYVAIPSEDSLYLKITTNKGKIPQIIVEVWKFIWDIEEKGKLSALICSLKKNNSRYAKRAYNVDFEVYNHRASDSKNAIADIYLGFKYTDSLE